MIHLTSSTPIISVRTEVIFRMGRLPLLAVALLLFLPTAFCVRRLNSGVVVHKCCPLGQTFKTAYSSECVAISNEKFTWPAKEGKDGNIHFGADDEKEGSNFNFNAKPYLKFTKDSVGIKVG